MAKRKNNTLTRRSSTRKYRKVYWVATEGQTEKDYLSMLIFTELPVSIRFARETHPSKRNPLTVLERLQKTIHTNNFRAGDEAWLVIDVDEWNKIEFETLLRWADENEQYHLAVSNPKFELFLIMHFEKGNGCTTAQQVDARLKQYMPAYSKRINERQFNFSDIKIAVENAKTKRISCKSALPDAGMTDVHNLIQSLLSQAAPSFNSLAN